MTTDPQQVIRWRLIAAVAVIGTCAVLAFLGILSGAEFIQSIGIVWPR